MLIVIIMHANFSTKVEFCELVFPMLIYNILANQNAECTAVLTQQFSGFLKANVKVNDGKVSMATNSSYIPSLRTIIDTILFLRNVNKPSERFVCLCNCIIIEQCNIWKGTFSIKLT